MIRRHALAALFIATASCAASAAEWVERPYNPPIGSRWIVESKSSTEEKGEGTSRTLAVNSRGELKVEGKTADGYRISYVSRSNEISGTSPNVALLRQITEIMDGVVIRAQTDAGGKPVRIENLEEVRATIRKVVDRMKANFASKPAVAEMLDKLMTSILLVDETRAAALYIDNMVLLVMGQKTGLTVGELRRSVEETPSPIGGGELKSNIAFQIVNADPATGKVSYLRTSAADAASVKDMTTKMVRQLLSASGDTATADKFESVMKQMDISMNGRIEIDVEDGMTRRVRDQNDMRASAMGRTMTKLEIKTVTVMPAP